MMYTFVNNRSMRQHGTFYHSMVKFCYKVIKLYKPPVTYLFDNIHVQKAVSKNLKVTNDRPLGKNKGRPYNVIFYFKAENSDIKNH